MNGVFYGVERQVYRIRGAFSRVYRSPGPSFATGADTKAPTPANFPPKNFQV